jgi:hypothetical protein
VHAADVERRQDQPLSHAFAADAAAAVFSNCASVGQNPDRARIFGANEHVAAVAEIEYRLDGWASFY